MSVLFISEPQPFSPVYNPLNFVFYSLDHGTEADFKYIVDVEVNGVFVSQHEVYNTNVGQARFDCSEVVKARLTSSILALSEITTDYFNSICEYQITVTEYYNGATHDTTTSTELRAFNGSLRTDKWLQWNWNDYTLNSDGSNFKKFLTDFPRNEKQFVRSTDSCYIGMLTNNNITGVNVELFDVSGNTITTTTLPIAFGSNLFVINPNVALIEELTGVSFDNCYYYEVFIAGLLSTSETFRFYIDRECERYPSVRLVWLNKYGVWDAYTFKLDSISESDIQTIMHESTLGQWSDSGYNYAIANGQHLTHLKEVTDRLILNSDWIKPSVQNWLVRSLYESPLVYIESVDFTQQEVETCESILVTYTLVGEEPVTVEVGQNEDGKYVIEEVGTVTYVDGEWIVTNGGIPLFVAVAQSGTNRISNSVNGIDWISADFNSNLFLSVTYGNGLFVAVGVNAIRTSIDGITWVSMVTPEANNWSSVTYGNNVFVAVSRNGTNRVMTSTNGILWTSRSASENNTWNSVVFANGLFVAVASDGTNRVMTSSDGITWVSRTASENTNWLSVTYGNGLFVAVSEFGTNRVMTSVDGITWISRTASEANQWQSITYGNGLFVAVSLNGTNRVMTSSDGITWTSRSASEANQWRSVTYGNGLFVAVSSNGTNRAMKSVDGITWTSSTITDNQWFSVTYGAEIYATLPIDTPCPFGTYTIEAGSIFEAFEVAPISLTVPSWSYEPLNVMNELSRQKTSKRDMLIQEQVTAKRTFDYKSQIL